MVTVQSNLTLDQAFSSEQSLAQNLSFGNLKKKLFRELREIYTEIDSKDEKIKSKALEKHDVVSRKVLSSIGTLSHFNLMETFTERYQLLAYDLSEKMYAEYDCKNETERMLVEIIVNSYIRTLDNSRRLNNEFEGREITQNRNVYIANLSKQLDRANRQYLQALLTLKQLKTPSLELKINATNAFLSNNQQVNIKQNEIIKPI